MAKRNYEEQEYKILQEGWRLYGTDYDSIKKLGLSRRDTTAISQKLRKLVADGILPVDHTKTPTVDDNFVLRPKRKKNTASPTRRSPRRRGGNGQIRTRSPSQFATDLQANDINNSFYSKRLRMDNESTQSKHVKNTPIIRRLLTEEEEGNSDTYLKYRNVFIFSNFNPFISFTCFNSSIPISNHNSLVIFSNLHSNISFFFALLHHVSSS
ncbi:MAG: hypothetical protein ACYCT1_20430 [Steroidobacteraceae bacterium]